VKTLTDGERSAQGKGSTLWQCSLLLADEADMPELLWRGYIYGDIAKFIRKLYMSWTPGITLYSFGKVSESLYL